MRARRPVLALLALLCLAAGLRGCDELRALEEGRSEGCTFPPVPSQLGASLEVRPEVASPYVTHALVQRGAMWDVVANITAPPYRILDGDRTVNVTFVNATTGSRGASARVSVIPIERLDILCPPTAVIPIGERLEVTAWSYGVDANVSVELGAGVLALESAQNVTAMVRGLVKLAAFRAVGAGEAELSISARRGNATLDSCSTRVTVPGAAQEAGARGEAEVEVAAELSTSARVVRGDEELNATVVFTNGAERILRVDVDAEGFDVLGRWGKDGRPAADLVMKPRAGDSVRFALRPRFVGRGTLNVTFSVEPFVSNGTLATADVTRLASGTLVIRFSRRGAEVDRVEAFSGEELGLSVVAAGLVPGVEGLEVPLNASLESEGRVLASRELLVESGKGYLVSDLGLAPPGPGNYSVWARSPGLSGDGSVVLVVRSPLSQSIELGERAQRTLARAPARFPFAVSLSGEAWPGLERTLSAAAGPGCAGSVAVEGLERSGAGWAVPPRTSVNGTLVVTLSEGSCTVSLEVTGDGARCAPASAVAEASVVPLDGLRRARAESLALSEKAALLEEAGRFESRRAAVARRNAAVGGLPGILLGLGAGGVLGALAALALLKSPPEAGGREGRSSAAAPPPRVAEARTKDEGHEGPAVPGGVDRDGQRA